MKDTTKPFVLSRDWLHKMHCQGKINDTTYYYLSRKAVDKKLKAMVKSGARGGKNV